MERVTVKVLKPFQYNGTFCKVGDQVDMNINRAANHMRVGDVERDEVLIQRIKDERRAAGEAAIADANKDW